MAIKSRNFPTVRQVIRNAGSSKCFGNFMTPPNYIAGPALHWGSTGNPAIHTYATRLRARTYTTAVLLADSTLSNGARLVARRQAPEKDSLCSAALEPPWDSHISHVINIKLIILQTASNHLFWHTLAKQPLLLIHHNHTLLRNRKNSLFVTRHFLRTLLSLVKRFFVSKYFQRAKYLKVCKCILLANSVRQWRTQSEGIGEWGVARVPAPRIKRRD